MSDYNQDCIGTLLVTLSVLTHIRFLHLVVSKYSIYCWLMWTEKATNCCVEVGSCHLQCSHSYFIFLYSLANSKTPFVSLWTSRSLVCLLNLIVCELAFFFSLILGCFDFFPLLSSWIHSWVWCLVIKYFFPCLSHLFIAHWFKTWNVAFHDSFCFYFSFVFYFRIPFHLSNTCLWGFFWKLLEHGIQILKNEVEIKCRVLCKLICWNRGRSYTCCLGSHRKVVLGICFKKESVLKRKKLGFRCNFEL